MEMEKCPMHGKQHTAGAVQQLLPKKVQAIIEEKGGILLNLGCGVNPVDRFVNLDLRSLPGVDVVHDMEEFPWPFPDDCCITITASHVFEHIKPWFTVDWMNEIWRITKVGGQLAISAPYGVNHRYVQDPTHCNPINEYTWQYFDPRFPLWGVYEPKPWHIDKKFPTYAPDGDIEVLLEKIKEGKKEEEDEKTTT
jgi:hypothetical protein